MTKEEFSASVQIQATLSHFRDLLNSVNCPKCYSEQKVKELTKEINTLLLPMWQKLHENYRNSPATASNIDEASWNYADKKTHLDNGVFTPNEAKEQRSKNLFNWDDIREAHKAGAVWMARQGVSYEDEVLDDDVMGYCLEFPSDMIELEKHFKSGDKVLVQIRKK